MSLKAIPQSAADTIPNAATETLELSETHVEYLERMARELNPAVERAFGRPHAIRAILDQIERSGIDLTAASSEEEIAVLAAAALRSATASGPLCASASNRSAARPGYRSNLPVKGRCRSGRPPRSGRE